MYIHTVGDTHVQQQDIRFPDSLPSSALLFFAPFFLSLDARAPLSLPGIYTHTRMNRTEAIHRHDYIYILHL